MEWIAPLLVIVGTAGLLLNELIFDWGRPATLAFAALNVIGLAQLVITFTWGRNKERGDSSSGGNVSNL